MGFEAVSIIVLILAVLGIILIILRHLPQAVKLVATDEAAQNGETLEQLEQKGVELREPLKLKRFITFWVKRLWFFALEAKGMRPGQKVGYRLKRMLKKQPAVTDKPIVPPVKTDDASKNEAYFLEKIKENPKDIDSFKGLGTFYLDTAAFAEARDVFEYVVKHAPADAAAHGKLAYAAFQLKDFDAAIENYKKSLTLDSAQPNRYYNLGLVYEAVLDHQQALAQMYKAIEIDPTNQKYRDTLERIKKRMV